MNIFSPLCSGPEFAAFNNITPDSLYDWRRRGVDLGLSAATNGRKEYSVYDCLEAFLLSELRQIHYDDIKVAFTRARAVAPQVARIAGLSLAAWPLPFTAVASGRFVMIANDGGVKVTDDLSDLTAMTSPVVEVLDAERLHARIWAKFEARMISAFPPRELFKD